MSPRPQSGRFSKLSADQMDAIRRIHRDCQALLALRAQLCKELSISTQYFSKVGRGMAGKKPRVS